MMTQQPELVALGMWSQMVRIFCSISKELTPLFDYSFSLLVNCLFCMFVCLLVS